MMNPVLDAIQKRRAVFQKQYNDSVISDEDLQAILEAGNAAPTHKRTEPWRFVIFRKKGLGKLGKELARLYKETTPADTYNEKKAENTLEKAKAANVVVAIVVNYTGRVPEWEELAATACAVQNMWLAAHSLGIGSYWSSPQTIQHLDGFLDLDENQKCIGLFYMGHTDVEAALPNRTEVDDKILKWVEE